MTTRYVLQDGADFHTFADADCKRYCQTISAPFKVPDMGIVAAEAARQWFTRRDYAGVDYVFV